MSGDFIGCWQSVLQSSVQSIYNTLSKGLICLYLVEHSIFDLPFLAGDLLSVGGLFYRVQFHRYLEYVIQGFDLFVFVVEHSILVFSAIFVWRFIECWQSVLLSSV